MNKFNIGDRVRVKNTYYGDCKNKIGIIHVVDVNKHYQVVFAGTKNMIPLIPEEYLEKLDSIKLSNNIIKDEKGFLKCDSALVSEVKRMKPIDTTTKFHDDSLDATKYFLGSFEHPYYSKRILGVRSGKSETHANSLFNYYHLFFDEIEIGLPHEVHFKEKKNRTTLVWKRGDNYSTTTSEAHEEKFDRLYGFLMAYFKKVYQYKSKTWRKKYLEKNVYTLKHKEQINYLTMIFAQNCGLETEKVYEYLKEIVKDKE